MDTSMLAAAGAPPALFGVAAATVGFAAALLALTIRIIRPLSGVLGPFPWRRSLVGATVGLVVIIPVAALLFRGTGISSKWYAPYGPFVVGPVLFLLTVLGLRVGGALARWAGGGLRRRVGIAALCSAGFALFTWADLRLYPNQYGYLHWVLLLGSVMALVAAGWVLLRELHPSRLRVLAVAPLILAVPGVVIAALTTPAAHSARALLAQRTHTAGRLVAVGRALFDRDHDGHSVIFGESDCDNGDPRIYPFAPDLPQNGVDEDCDGADAVPPRPPDPRTLDAAGYRRALARWRAAGPLATQLARTSRFNVVLITLDDLRQDLTTPTAENRANHPRLIRLLQSCRNFRRAFSAGAGTDIGVATLLTGQLDPFDPRNPTLFELLGRAGFRTHGVYQREVNRWLGRQFDLRGLRSRKLVINDPVHRDKGTHPTSRQVTDLGIRFLERHGDQRFLLWLHYFDIHEHHQIDPRNLDEPGARSVPQGRPFYRLMVHHVDRHLGRFLDALDRLQLRQHTLLVVAADHGEGLADEPRLPEFHGDVLYNTLIHVPLAFCVPGVSPAALDEPVSLADVLPTLADLTGVQAPPVQGISLVPWLFDLHRQELRGLVRPLFLIEAKQQGVIRWPWKLMRRLDQGLVELYQLERDFGEKHNLVDERPQIARQMAAVLNSRKLITIDRLKKRSGNRR